MGEREGYVIVQWVSTGEWFVGRRTDGSAQWEPRRGDARKFDSIEHFREVERDLFPQVQPWNSEALRFIRVTPRRSS